MLRSALHRVIDFVTSHNRITLVVMFLLTLGVLAGIPQLDTASQAGGSSGDFQDVERVQKAQYIEDVYGSVDENSDDRTVATVYVRNDDGNVLSKESLLEELRYQRTVRENESVTTALHDRGIGGIANLVATRATDEPDPDLSAQIAALDAASASEVEQLVAETITAEPQARAYLPTAHDAGSASATDKRILVVLDGSASDETLDAATATLHQAAIERADAGFFTIGQQALESYRGHFFAEMTELVLPLALLLILVVLAFTYRDVVDIVVGMTGVVLSVLWTFGMLGWIGVDAGMISIVPVVLISGLSIDFGFHVFNRYREQRGDGEGIRDPMNRGTRLVATALVLVTVTAAIGFLANLANPMAVIRDLGVSVTLGVVSAFVIFLTVVPALKIGIDGTLERFGFDRRKQALGQGRFLKPLLRRSVWLAKRAAPVVLVVAVVVGAAGGLAWASLDQQSFQQADGEVAEWKQELPQPLGWETHEWTERSQHVQSVYQPASEADAFRSRLLIEGDVTDPATLAAIHEGTTEVDEAGLLLDQPGTTPVRSPVTVMQAVAEGNEEFAAAFEAADTDGDGIPDQDVEALYDALYAANGDLASQVVERSDGRYRSLLVTLSLDADYTQVDEVVGTLEGAADTIERGGSDLTVTAAGSLAVEAAQVEALVDGILLTMVIALVAIVLTLSVVFRLMHGSASLGAVVAVPIALVVGLVIGGMYLLDIPLTLLTALLMSLVVGLGVDYNIHVGDRFADELDAGKSVDGALTAAVTGTGGALLGSTLTTVGAFATITLVPHPQLQSFGSIVMVALLTAFVVSVLVLPSLLLLWARWSDVAVTARETTAGVTPQD